MSLAGKANHAPIFDAGRNLDVDPLDLVSAANLQSVAAPLGGDLETERSLRRSRSSPFREPRNCSPCPNGPSPAEWVRGHRRPGTAPARTRCRVPHPSKTVAEKLVEQFAQVDGVGSVRAAGPCRSVRPPRPAVESVAVAVVLHPFFGVAQHRIGRLDLFELVGGVFIPGTNVGVIFARASCTPCESPRRRRFGRLPNVL